MYWVKSCNVKYNSESVFRYFANAVKKQWKCNRKDLYAICSYSSLKEVGYVPLYTHIYSWANMMQTRCKCVANMVNAVFTHTFTSPAYCHSPQTKNRDPSTAWKLTWISRVPIFSHIVCVWTRVASKAPGGGGWLPLKVTGRLVVPLLGCKLQISVSLGVFGTESYHFSGFSGYRLGALGLCREKFSNHVVMSFFVCS